MKRTKIVCTIGPASEAAPTIKKMIRAGMNAARLNFSHNVYAHHRMLIKNIRKAAGEAGVAVGIIQDLQGPRIRIGEIKERGGVKLAIGEKVILLPEENIKKFGRKKNFKILPVHYHDLARCLKKGDRILISDGLIELIVEKINGRAVYCRVKEPGAITSLRGINLPDSKIRGEVITEKDKKDLAFGLKQGVDWIAMSFVRNEKDILKLDSLIRQNNHEKYRSAKIMAKIENDEAVGNFDKILAVADGIMIARGDLGIELPPENVPIIQKDIIKKCLVAGKPVVVATQMMESMMKNPRPTRAEVSDVANAVIDHADALMLSGETATGQYPVEAVSIMAKTAEGTEQSPYDDMPQKRPTGIGKFFDDFVGMAGQLTKQTDIKTIVAVTRSGYTALAVARTRPETRIVAITENKKIASQLSLVWGVESLVGKISAKPEEIIKMAVGLIKKNKIAKKGDQILIVATHRAEDRNGLHLVEAREV